MTGKRPTTSAKGAETETNPPVPRTPAPKRCQSNTEATLQFLREKAAKEQDLRSKELSLRERELALQEARFELEREERRQMLAMLLKKS